MAVVREHLEPAYPLGWRFTVRRGPVFAPRWHVHSEYELTAILRGHGTRMIGDSVQEYQPGDLVLIGPELPHTYASTQAAPDDENAAVVIHFTRDFLGDGFFALPAFASVAAMLDAAAGGVSFESRVDLAALEGLPTAELTVALLQVLVELSRGELTSLASGRAPVVVGSRSAGHVERMMGFAHERYRDPVTARDVAAGAHLHPGAASRIFTRSTGMSITRYLTTVRVNAACRMLRDGDETIASIAGATGFGNLSNFNRRFRQLRGMTPREYRSLTRSRVL